MPSALNPPPGCRFHTRCPYVIDRCRIEPPQLLATMASDMRPPVTAPAELPPADAVVAADGAFSPALERWWRRSAAREEVQAVSGFDIVGGNAADGRQ